MSTPFIQLYIGDYLRDTTGLTTEGHGAYILILFAMWNAGGWVPVAKLPLYARVTGKKWNALAPDVMPLLIVDGDQCSQKRLLKELEKATGKYSERSKAGKLGAEAKRLKTQSATQANATANALANDHAMVQHSSETIIINQKEEDTSSLRSDVRPPDEVKPDPIPEQVREPASQAVLVLESETVEPIPLALDRRPEAQALRAYNEAAEAIGWPKAQLLSETRRRGIKARLRDCGGVDGWREAMTKARASPFLNGSGKRSPGHENWQPDIDFFLQASKFTKLMEGGYDERTNHESNNGFPSPVFKGAARAIARLQRSREAGSGLEGADDYPAGTGFAARR